MFPTPPSIAIIGFGSFGRLLAELLSAHAPVSVCDRSDEALQEAEKLGLKTTDVVDVSADIVILAVPVQKLGECLREISPQLRPGQLVVDVCSIKEEPVHLMMKSVPEYVEILASHPMFGPKAARNGLSGCQIVLCPIRGEKWRALAAFLRLMRFNVFITTPEEHDRQAAMTQGLTHLLARAVASIGPRPKIRTPSYDLIAEALAMVANDGPELFEAVTLRNRHVSPIRDILLSNLSSETRKTEGINPD